MLILRFLRSQATQRDTIADLVGSSELADQYIQASVLKTVKPPPPTTIILSKIPSPIGCPKNFCCWILHCPLDHGCQMVNKCTTESFKFIDPLTKKRQHFLVLHYNGEISQKWDLVITFDWGILLTQDNWQCVWTALCGTWLGTLKYVPKYGKI